MSKLGLYLAGAIGLTTLALFAVVWFMDKGSEIERAKQEKENAEFVIRSNAGRSSYLECDLADGLYDFKSGTCKLKSPGSDR